MPLALTLGDLNNDGADELGFGHVLTIEHYGSGNYKARISANLRRGKREPHPLGW